MHNLHRVSDTIYRSAQPTAQDMKNLAPMSIETAVSLRSTYAPRKKACQN